jgi:nitrate reductase delta subunit
MTPEKRLIFKIASHLLDYPDEIWLTHLELLKDAIAEIPSDSTQEVFAEFLLHLQSRKLISWQEEYSRIFDLNPATCLNLTYHRYGDQKERGAALAQLHQLYHRAGYEAATGELSDYLPLVLEFLSFCPEEECAWVVKEYQPQDVWPFWDAVSLALKSHAHCPN